MTTKKNFRSVASDLASVAERLPTQNVTHARADQAGQGSAPSATSEEPQVQFSFSLRKSLRKELARLADDADMTMRAFILNALKAKGLSVTDDDLLDLRREQGRGR